MRRPPRLNRSVRQTKREPVSMLKWIEEKADVAATLKQSSRANEQSATARDQEPGRQARLEPRSPGQFA
jgi:hypothetical protein